MDNSMLTTANETTNEQTAVEAIRESSRRSLFLNRRRLKDEETDVRRCIGTCSSQSNVTEIVDRLKTKSSISAEELKILKNALIDDKKTTEVVLNTHGALRGLVRELSGHNAENQCAAAGCLCNMGLGDSKVCSVVAKAAGSYLVAFLDNMTEELAEVNHDHGEAIIHNKNFKKQKEIETVTITHTKNDKALQKCDDDPKADKTEDIIALQEIKSDDIITSVENFNKISVNSTGSSSFDECYEKLPKNDDDTEVQFINNGTFVKENVINIVKVENDDQIIVLLKNDNLITRDENDIEPFNDNDIAISEVGTNDEFIPIIDDTLDLRDDVIDVKLPKSNDTFILKKEESEIQILTINNNSLELKGDESVDFSTQIESNKCSDDENYNPIENNFDIEDIEDTVDITQENPEIQYREIEVKVKMHKGIQIETPEDLESLNLANVTNKISIENKSVQQIESETQSLKEIQKPCEITEFTDSENDVDNFETKESETDDENVEIKSETVFSSGENDDGDTDCSDEDETESDNEELLNATKQMTEVVIALTNLINKKCANNEDECDIFGKLIALRLRKLPEIDRLELMHEIDELFLARSSREPAMTSCRMSPVSEPEY